MNYLVVFINLFVVSALIPYLFRKCRGSSPEPSLDLLFQYCAAVSGNLVLTKFLLYFLRTITALSPSMDSALYTLVALAAACLLTLLCLIVNRLQIEISVSEVEEANESHNEKRAR